MHMCFCLKRWCMVVAYYLVSDTSNDSHSILLFRITASLPCVWAEVLRVRQSWFHLHKLLHVCFTSVCSSYTTWHFSSTRACSLYQYSHSKFPLPLPHSSLLMCLCSGAGLWWVAPHNARGFTIRAYALQDAVVHASHVSLNGFSASIDNWRTCCHSVGHFRQVSVKGMSLCGEE